LVVWFQFAASLRISLDETLEVQAADVRAALRVGDTASIARQDPAEPGTFSIVSEASGRIVQRSAGVPPGLTIPARGATTETVDIGGQAYRLLSLEAAAGRTIVIGTSLAPLDRSLTSLARLETVVGVFGSLLSVVGGWWLAGRALTPVDVIIREADTIGLDDLERRLPESGQRDELDRLTRTLNAMLDRVRSAIHREHAFIAAASHDLRTPIAAMRAELELADDPTLPPDVLSASIRRAHGDAVRISDLAADLLTLAESEAEGRELVRTPVRVDAMVGGTIQRLAPLAAERAIQVDARAAPVAVTVDRIRLEQALANLVSNAVGFAPVGSTVDVIAEVDGNGRAGPGRQLEVSVLDRGPGVAPDVRSRLFVPFGARSTGHGLGLATAAAAVRAHAGEIGYRDRPGGGAEFWFRVPA
jgi:two-component system OmpR family sensor kinase